MKWDTVVVAIRYGQDVEEARTEMQFLQDCGLFETETLLVVADPCDDVGSAGSALNALLTTAEHLCARRGLSVLNESLLESSKILILQLGSPDESLPLGAGFLPLLKIAECPWIMPDYPIVHTIHNVNELAANCDHGVWICGTDTLWKLPGKTNEFNLKSDEIAAFCFEGDCQQTLSHGTYEVDDEDFVKSLSYRCQYVGDNPRVILALLYLPPSLSTRFLSLYSVYPISRSTYYGVDSGTLGLKLSLFFDLIMATCLPLDEFVSTHLAANKSDRNLDVLEQSRRKIWERFHLCKCRAHCLPLTHYEYLGDLQHSGNMLPKQEVIRVNLQNSVLSRISAMVLSDSQEYSTALLKTLMAININYPHMKKDILAVLESLCVRGIPHCARALMLTAEYLAILARGRGGLRSGPAANPAFTHIFESMKKDPNGNHISELFHAVREKWLRSETEMIRAARHLEAAAQIYTQHEVEKICRKHFAGIPNESKRATPQSVTVEAAARVDLFGGWLDTPPITLYANPSAVVNMAILVDGKKPIACHIRHGFDAGITVRCGDTIVLLSSSQDIYESYNKPGNPGALVCACLICVGVPSGPEDDLLETLQNRFGTTGMEIECTSCLPHGSGLGTSSILAAAIIQALGLASGFHYTEKSICHAVLMVEQLLTTGGGWQDQVGCLYPGVKKGFFNKSDDSVDVERIDISDEFEKEINSRMVLIYTGKTRLAKNLLQEVVRGWFSGGPIRDVIASLENNVTPFATSIKKGKMPCKLIELYYNAKKTLATGCEPEIVTSLISHLKRENLIKTAWLAGAGGGGFLYVWLKDGITVDQIRTFISRYGTAEMTVHTVTVDNSPITMSSS
uniref:GHMP_kinases_N domain-containing protein n=1 Tax=Haemonchus contortus TaxID=6289 RepID=A0A7I5E748_HAECO